jgi:hypothetical protein
MIYTSPIKTLSNQKYRELQVCVSVSVSVCVSVWVCVSVRCQMLSSHTLCLPLLSFTELPCILFHVCRRSSRMSG